MGLIFLVDLRPYLNSKHLPCCEDFPDLERFGEAVFLKTTTMPVSISRSLKLPHCLTLLFVHGEERKLV